MNGKLRKTDGLPLFWGTVSGAFLFTGDLLLYFCVSNLSNALSVGGQPEYAELFGMFGKAGIAVSFLLYPGAFLAALFSGKTEEKRGPAFGLFWIAFSLFAIWQEIGKAVRFRGSFGEIEKQMFPCAMLLAVVCLVLGSVCVIFSCVSFLRKG